MSCIDGVWAYAPHAIAATPTLDAIAAPWTRTSPHAHAGGSGSSTEDIQYAIEAGTIKMNIDTDTQWSFWVRGPRPDYISTFAGRTFVQHTGRHPRVRGREPRLPPAADRQPRRRGQAEQEVLRPAHVPALGGGGDGRAAGQGHGGPEVRERLIDTYKTNVCSPVLIV